MKYILDNIFYSSVNAKRDLIVIIDSGIFCFIFLLFLFIVLMALPKCDETATYL